MLQKISLVNLSSCTSHLQYFHLLTFSFEILSHTLSPLPLSLSFSPSLLYWSPQPLSLHFPFIFVYVCFLHICLCMCVGEQIYIHLYPSEKTADFRIHSFTSPTIFQRSLYHKFDVPFFYNKLPLTLYISEFMLPNTQDLSEQWIV